MDVKETRRMPLKPPEKASPIFLEECQRWLAMHNNLSIKQLYTMRKTVWQFLRWLDVKMITPETLQAYINELTPKRHPMYIANKVGILSTFFESLVTRGIMRVNPAKVLKKPKNYSKEPYEGYTHEEYNALLTDSDECVRNYAIVAWHTGMSFVDVATLTWGDVDMDRLMINKQRVKMATRNRTRQIVPIVPGSELHHLLATRASSVIGTRSPEMVIFPEIHYYAISGPGRPRNAFRFRVRLAKACKRVGIQNKGTHAFRRAFISAMVNDTRVNLIHAARVVGHSSLNMLKGYVRPKPEAIRDSISPILEDHFKHEEKRKHPRDIWDDLLKEKEKGEHGDK